MNAVTSRQLRGQIKYQEPMSKHTSWRVGGPADEYFMPADLEDLQRYLRALDAETPITWVGLGSNILVRDGGIRGVVIAPLGGLKRLELVADCLVLAESGLSNSKVARFCQKHHLSGAEYLAGIPGTIGGALTMNAGAFGSETWSLVDSVTMVNRRGELIHRPAADFEFTYRHVRLPVDEWFVSVRLKLTHSYANENKGIRDLLQKRNDSQPIGLPSCGSVFKNPPGNHAAKLIEEAGLKGHRLGSASVSDKHANFIISYPNTTANDIEVLIDFIRETVKQKFGILLETEVRIIGEGL